MGCSDVSSILFGAIAVVLCAFSVVAQGPNPDCEKRVEYVNRNQVDTPTISLRGVEGRAVDSSGVAVPKICVVLFTEKEYKFVAQTVTDENGYFRFQKIGNGNYRLVGRLEYDYLCPVNVRIRR